MTGRAPLPILFEDAEALVIDKPAGLPIDAARSGGRSLDDFLSDLRLGFARLPVAVHRLDRDTSGCLLLARHRKALARFNAAFEARTVEKRYLGVVAGAVDSPEGSIELPLAKISSREAGWRMVVARDGRSAVTHWRRLVTLHLATGPVTLVEFRPETGRTHQIRVHAAEGLGLPLLGDPVYGRGAEPGAVRTLLHAAALTVPRAGKPAITAQAPMPADFRALGFSDEAESAPEPASHG